MITPDLEWLELANEEKTSDRGKEDFRQVQTGVIVSKDGTGETTGSRPNTAWVRLGDQDLVQAVVPKSIAPVAGTSVQVARDPKNQDELRILDLADSNMSETPAGMSDYETAKKHWWSHHHIRLGFVGADPGLVSVRMVEPFRVTALGEFECVLTPFSYTWLGELKTVNGLKIDFTDHLPVTPNYERWVAVHVNLETTEIIVTPGDIVDLTDPPVPVLPTLPPLHAVAGYVRLYYGQTDITESHDLFPDGRTPFNLPSGYIATNYDDPEPGFLASKIGDGLIIADNKLVSTGLAGLDGVNYGDIIFWNGDSWEVGSMVPPTETVIQTNINTSGATTLIEGQNGKVLKILSGFVSSLNPAQTYFTSSDATRVSPDYYLPDDKRIFEQRFVTNPHFKNLTEGQGLVINIVEADASVNVELDYLFE